MRRLGNLLLLPLLLLPAAAGAQGWAGFYDRKTLLYWESQTPPDIEENFRDVVWPRLTPDEKRILGRVTLDFPLEDAQHPMNFYARAGGGKKIITLPVSSLRFLGDIALAYAWLAASGFATDPIMDYVAMLKYQWPDGLAGRRYRPREALGIPDDATANARVDSQFQRIFGTAIVFVLSHELGHLYHRHGTEVSPERSRQQEEEADRFAMEVMRRIGEAPLGMVQFFSVLAYLEPYTSDPDYLARRSTATHPVTSSRLRAIAAGLETYSADFSRTGTPRTTFASLATDVRSFARTLDEAGVQSLIRQKGLTAKPELLGPRKPGVIIAGAPPGAGQAHVPFSGNYRGKWLNTKGTDFDVEMGLTRQGDAVQGSYRFGAGNVAIEGIVSNDILFYKWKWGTEYFGKGILKPDASGRELIGTWGYTQAESGAGTWKLRRAD
jgi:peptidase M48-like protein